MARVRRSSVVFRPRNRAPCRANRDRVVSPPSKGWTWAPVLLAAVALVGVVLAALAGREALGFTLTSLVTVLAVVIIFGSLYPNVLPIHGAASLTIDNASSTQNTLTVMSWVALVMTPIVLAYQAWSYWVFRKRLGLGDIPATAGLAPITSGV
jgi:cytochrome d ubiquinol oxidase subunit II